MDFTDILTNLAAVSQAEPKGATSAFPGLSQGPEEYVQFECVALETCLGIAREFPSNELGIWHDFSSMMVGFNEELREFGAHELKIVPFDVFFAMTKMDLEEAA